MIDDTLKDVESRMEKTIEALRKELAKVRTGRAHPSLLDQVQVPYYGSDAPLSQVANISVSDARTLTLEPWDKTLMSTIEKAIIDSNLGLNPATSSDKIRIPMPVLTEERRRELAKIVKSEAESSRVSIRNIRRDANGEFKLYLKEKEITEDDSRRGEDLVQKVTDRFIAQIDELVEEKEKDLMAV